MAKYSEFNSPDSSPSGGTSVNTIDGSENLPANPALGENIFDITNKIFYTWTGASWRTKQLINNIPTILNLPSLINLSIDGTSIDVTLSADDPEGFPLTWSYESLNLNNQASISQNTSNSFTINPIVSDNLDFTIKFIVSDGINQASQEVQFVTSIDWTTPFLNYAFRNLKQSTSFNTQLFGSQIDISGKIAVISDIYANSNSGIVYVYKQDSQGAWTEKAQLVDSEGIELTFGIHISIENYTIVSSSDSGKIHIFDSANEGETWQLTQVLDNPGSVQNILLKNNLLLITDRNYNNNQGRILQYEKSGTLWAPTQQIDCPAAFVVTGVNASAFGIEFQMTSNWLVVAQPYYLTPSNNNAGRAHFYKNVSGTWTYHSTKASGTTQSYDGFPFGLSLNDNYAVLPSPRGLSPSNGYLEIYEYNEGIDSWTLGYSLTDDYSPPSNLGRSTALLDDVLFVSQSSATVRSVSGLGSVIILKRDPNDGTWPLINTTTGIIVPATTYINDSDSRFGSKLALDRNVLLISAPQADSPTENNVGNVFSFTTTDLYVPTTITPDYTITVTNSGQLYLLSGSDRNGSFTNSLQGPLTFWRGDIIKFVIDSGTASSHPFYIKTAQSTGSLSNLVSDVEGQGTTELVWDTSTATVGGSYGYQCSIHFSMWNTITIDPEVPA